MAKSKRSHKDFRNMQNSQYRGRGNHAVPSCIRENVQSYSRFNTIGPSTYQVRDQKYRI